MICYQDRTFCSFYRECNDGAMCDRALTDEVLEDAKRWFGESGAPVSEFAYKPECFKSNKPEVE